MTIAFSPTLEDLGVVAVQHCSCGTAQSTVTSESSTSTNFEGCDLIEEVPLPTKSVDISSYKAKIRLREGWEGLNYSHSAVDQVKLHAIVNDNPYLCPLIGASHNELGNVLLKLLFSYD